MSFSLEAFLNDLKDLCAIDSGHGNRAGTQAMADFFERRYRALGMQVQRLYWKDNDFAPFLLAENGAGGSVDVLMVAHMDTVFPVGEGAARPFAVDENGIGHGPGCVDCKGGCLLSYYLVRELLEEGTPLRLAVALNSDEERGSRYSRDYFEELAGRARTCLIFEPGRANDEFVSQRKGGVNECVRCYGIAAHSGVNPEDGASAIVELARWIPQLQALNDYAAGTSLNIGRIAGGGDNGQVPDYCECTLSFRSLAPEAVETLKGVLERMQAAPFDPRVRIEVEQVSLRPAMVVHPATEALLRLLEDAGRELDLPVQCLTTGGGSDGNFIAYRGVATLDGCGPCGAALHTKGEYLKIDSVEKRFRLMKRLLEKLSEEKK